MFTEEHITPMPIKDFPVRELTELTIDKAIVSKKSEQTKCFSVDCSIRPFVLPIFVEHSYTAGTLQGLDCNFRKCDFGSFMQPTSLVDEFISFVSDGDELKPFDKLTEHSAMRGLFTERTVALPSGVEKPCHLQTSMPLQFKQTNGNDRCHRFDVMPDVNRDERVGSIARIGETQSVHHGSLSLVLEFFGFKCSDEMAMATREGQARVIATLLARLSDKPVFDTKTLADFVKTFKIPFYVIPEMPFVWNYRNFVVFCRRCLPVCSSMFEGGHRTHVILMLLFGMVFQNYCPMNVLPASLLREFNPHMRLSRSRLSFKVTVTAEDDNNRNRLVTRPLLNCLKRFGRNWIERQGTHVKLSFGSIFVSLIDELRSLEGAPWLERTSSGFWEESLTESDYLVKHRLFLARFAMKKCLLEHDTEFDTEKTTNALKNIANDPRLSADTKRRLINKEVESHVEAFQKGGLGHTQGYGMVGKNYFCATNHRALLFILLGAGLTKEGLDELQLFFESSAVCFPQNNTTKAGLHLLKAWIADIALPFLVHICNLFGKAVQESNHHLDPAKRQPKDKLKACFMHCAIMDLLRTCSRYGADPLVKNDLFADPFPVFFETHKKWTFDGSLSKFMYHYARVAEKHNWYESCSKLENFWNGSESRFAIEPDINKYYIKSPLTLFDFVKSYVEGKHMSRQKNWVLYFCF